MQRVSRSAVHAQGHAPVQIGGGLLILLGVARDDTPDDLRFVAGKCANLRIFEDGDGKMNRSLLDTAGEALVVSQFTLYADTRKGRRPGFAAAAPPEIAERLYDEFVEALRRLPVPVKTGVFGAHMHLEIHNDGPVTILIETP